MAAAPKRRRLRVQPQAGTAQPDAAACATAPRLADAQAAFEASVAAACAYPGFWHSAWPRAELRALSRALLACPASRAQLRLGGVGGARRCASSQAAAESEDALYRAHRMAPSARRPKCCLRVRAHDPPPALALSFSMCHRCVRWHLRRPHARPRRCTGRSLSRATRAAGPTRAEAVGNAAPKAVGRRPSSDACATGCHDAQKPPSPLWQQCGEVRQMRCTARPLAAGLVPPHPRHAAWLRTPTGCAVKRFPGGG